MRCEEKKESAIDPASSCSDSEGGTWRLEYILAHNLHQGGARSTDLEEDFVERTEAGFLAEEEGEEDGALFRSSLAELIEVEGRTVIESLDPAGVISGRFKGVMSGRLSRVGGSGRLLFNTK